MKYKVLALPVLLLGTACSPGEKPSAERLQKDKVEELAQTSEETQTESKVSINPEDLKIPVPKKYEMIDSVAGDLDQDNVPELVVAYNTSVKTDDEGIKRSLCIYKLKNDQWELWKESKSALLGSEQGGMMGDPYGDMEISKGVLSIYHNGGSSWKWSYIDKYRYQQNDFALIGFVSNYGKPCEYWQNEDFNLSTGKFVYSKEYETCEDQQQETSSNEKETFYKKDVHLTLFNRHEKEITFQTPKYKADIYL